MTLTDYRGRRVLHIGMPFSSRKFKISFPFFTCAAMIAGFHQRLHESLFFSGSD
jgi:hypothetical protein